MKLLSASALALTVAATGLAAESIKTDEAASANPAPMYRASSADMAGMEDNLIRTRDITGGTIYTTNSAEAGAWDGYNVFSDVDDKWNSIGEIEDVVLSRDGKVTGIVAEIGGFLDIGDKHVVIAIDDVNLVAVDDKEYAYVTNLSEEALEEMPSVDEGFWD